MAEPRWILEVHVDEQWHSAQGAVLQLPDERAVRRIELVEPRCLVGRASRARASVPHVDLPLDTGVSRRQAELDWREDGWWVRDLSSANGTHLCRVGEDFPGRPIERAELLGEGDQLRVGSWSLLVLRRANDETV